MPSANSAVGPSPALNEIELVSQRDSKITNVNVYVSRAEVTRLFKVAVKAGQNKLSILGLPTTMDHSSLRVEGRHGPGVIHDVTIATIPAPTTPDSPLLLGLKAQKTNSEKALARAKKCKAALEAYLSSASTEFVDVSKLEEVIKGYNANAEALDSKATELEQEIRDRADAIEVEAVQIPVQLGAWKQSLTCKATIIMYAEEEGEFEIALVYAVRGATWSPGYDIRVDMQAKDQAVHLEYKATITQTTGESWDDVPLTLETVAPTYGIGVPKLTPWTLSVETPNTMRYYSHDSDGDVFPPGTLRTRGIGSAQRYSDTLKVSDMKVSSPGAVSASYSVSGLISIPSDGTGHSVTIVRLDLDAAMSWICVPKKDTRVYLKAKIKNASAYTFLAGPASVYVDRSFISKSTIPLVSPEESFSCSLGLDASIRVTYHPCIKTASTTWTGLISQANVHSFTQDVTVYNTKADRDVLIRVVDQVPISQHESITVKIQKPALVFPTNALGLGGLKVPPAVEVSKGVVAAWMDEDDQGQELGVDAMGKDGKFGWTCTVPASTKVVLMLQYEVSAPVNVAISGI